MNNFACFPLDTKAQICQSMLHCDMEINKSVSQSIHTRFSIVQVGVLSDTVNTPFPSGVILIFDDSTFVHKWNELYCQYQQ